MFSGYSSSSTSISSTFSTLNSSSWVGRFSFGSGYSIWGSGWIGSGCGRAANVRAFLLSGYGDLESKDGVRVSKIGWGRRLILFFLFYF